MAFEAAVASALRLCTTDPSAGEQQIQSAATQNGEAFALSLCAIACAGESDLRQLAAILLRKQIKSSWLAISPPSQEGIKLNLLRALSANNDSRVVTAVGLAIVAITSMHGADQQLIGSLISMVSPGGGVETHSRGAGIHGLKSIAL